MSRKLYLSALSALRALFLGLLVVNVAHAQGQLTNGSSHNGEITVPGEADEWTFTCGVGVSLSIRATVLAGTGFEPELRLFRPGSASASASNNGAITTGVSHTTTVAGTYRIVVRDFSSSAPGTGSYRLFIAAPSLAYTTPGGDQGGDLSNGMFIDGRIDRADIDMFSVQVNALEELRVQIARAASGFTPLVAIYAPNGALLNYAFGATAKANVETTVAGNYTVIVFDTTNDDGTGSGNYRLYMSRSVAPYGIPTGDEGGAISSGAYYDGTVDRADMDTYQFEAVAGDLMVLQLADMTASTFQPMLRLYGPDGARITFQSGGTSSSLSLEAVIAGTYTVIVQDGSSDVSGSGAYRLYFTQSSKPSIVPPGDQGGELSGGGRYDGMIELSDIDTYQIELDADDLILLKVADTSNSDFDPEIALCGPDGKSVNSTTWQSVLSHRATAAGTYTVFVRDTNYGADESGTYRLYCAKNRGAHTIPPGDEGGALSDGGTYPGTMDLADIDVYHFEGTAGATYEIKVTETTATSFQPKIEIYDRNGDLVGDSFSGTAATVSFTAILSGEFTVVVQDSSLGFLGNYELTFNETPGSVPAPTGNAKGTLVNGGAQSGTLSGGASDLWDFDVQEGQEIWIQISVGLNPVCDYSIHAPDGSPVAYAVNRGGVTYRFKARQSGTHTVMIGPGSTSYQINFIQLPLSHIAPAGDEGGLMANGHNHSGSLTLGDMDIWEFHANASDRIWFQIQETGGIVYAPQFTIYSPSGRGVCSGYDLNHASGTFIAPEPGIYKVLLAGYLNGSVATYQVVHAKVPGAFDVPSGDEGGELESGGSHAGEITAGDVDLWTYHAEAGERVVLQHSDDVSFGFITNVRVYSPSGRLMASSIHSKLASFSMTAVESGTHTVFVSGHNGSTGRYHLRLAKAASRYSIPSGDEGGGFANGEMPGGSLSPGGIDMWSFHAVGGDSVTLNLTDTSGSSSFTAVMLVYAPDGSFVSGRASGTSFIASRSGTYTVVILETQSQVTGTYSLSGTGMTAKPAEVGVFQSGAGDFTIEWPSPSTGWILQESEDMQPANWIPCPAIPTDNGFEKSVTVGPNAAGSRFFRLARP